MRCTTLALPEPCAGHFQRHAMTSDNSNSQVRVSKHPISTTHIAVCLHAFTVSLGSSRHCVVHAHASQHFYEVIMKSRRSHRLKASLFAGVVSSLVAGGLCTVIVVGIFQVCPYTATCNHPMSTYVWPACSMFALAVWTLYSALLCQFREQKLTLICSLVVKTCGMLLESTLLADSCCRQPIQQPERTGKGWNM